MPLIDVAGQDMARWVESTFSFVNESTKIAATGKDKQEQLIAYKMLIEAYLDSTYDFVHSICRSDTGNSCTHQQEFCST